jgi:hypothetical protein
MKRQCSISIEKELHAEISRRAKLAGVNNSWLISKVLSGWIEAVPFEGPVEQTSERGAGSRGRGQNQRRANEAASP